MRLRYHTLRNALLLSAVCLLAAPLVVAQKKGFDGVVEHIEKNYNGKRTRIPMLRLANIIVKIVRPAGVKGFKLAMFDEQDFRMSGSSRSFDAALRQIMPKEWRPMLRVTSSSGGREQTFIYAKPAGKDLELMTVVMEPREAVVIQAKLNPDAVARFMSNPKIMGVSLAGNLRGRSSGPWMGSTTMANARMGPFERNSNIGRRIDPRDEAGYSLTGVKGEAPTPAKTGTAAPGEPERPALKTAESEEIETPARQEGDRPAETGVPTEPDSTAAIRIETQLVNLNIKAMDREHKPLPLLAKDDFIVYENGIRQEITHFHPANAPINLVLLLDLSGSTSDSRDVMLAAAKKFVDSLAPQDRVALAAFTREYYVVSDFTTDRAAIKERLGSLRKVAGGTHFYDAVWTTLDLLSKINDSRKAIVVLTDGMDEKLLGSSFSGSKRSFDLVLERVLEEDVSIYPIHLDAELGEIRKRLEDPERNERQRERMRERSLRPRETAIKQLEAMANESAGTLFSADSESDLEGVYQRVAAELRMLYSLAYSPENTNKDGGFRKINVEVKREGVALRTRRGYFAK